MTDNTQSLSNTVFIDNESDPGSWEDAIKYSQHIKVMQGYQEGYEEGRRRGRLSMKAEVNAMAKHLARVLDVVDEAYRKYCGVEFDGFDADDAAVLQAARTYWLNNFSKEK